MEKHFYGYYFRGNLFPRLLLVFSFTRKLYNESSVSSSSYEISQKLWYILGKVQNSIHIYVKTIPNISMYLLYFSVVNGMCYFPAAFQGEYVTQAIMSGVPTISYSTLSVLFDSIPVWGICHKRIGNNVILMDDTGGLTCYKCFNLVLRSSNVLQIHTAGLDKCYTTEERAIADCPSDMMIRERRAREIMLYRKFFYFIKNR